MSWSEVIGQEEARQRLLRMEKEGRLPHAMLFCGPSGSGKMALALAFASHLLCDEHDKVDDSCGHCASCAMLKTFEHPDLHFSYPVIRPTGTSSEHKMTSDDFAKEWHEMLRNGSYITIDGWLEAMGAVNQQAQIGVGESDLLLKKLSLKSSQGGYKVCLIWLPERMNAECANKLLKLLEEPPLQTVFIMICEAPEQLLDTIRSRTQRIDIKRIDTAAIEQALVARRNIEPGAARRIARVANGSWTKALEQLNADNENRQFLEVFISLMRLAYMRNIKELKKWSETVAGYGRERQIRLLHYFARMMRENFMYNFGNPELTYMTSEEENFSKNFARFVNERNIIELSDLLNLTIRDIGQNANAKIVFFDFAIKMIMYIKNA